MASQLHITPILTRRSFPHLFARYDHEVFYEQMPEFMAKYGPKG